MFLSEWSIERQVLHSQCKRLEAQNYNLTRTAEQLSLTMGVSIWDHAFMPASLWLAELYTFNPLMCSHLPFALSVMRVVSILQFLRSWWVRGRKWERRGRGCRPSWSTSGGVWHYLTFTGAGDKSMATHRGDLWHQLSDRFASDSEGTVRRTRRAGARPLSALEALEEPILVLLCFWTVSDDTWLGPEFLITCHVCHGNCKPCWPYSLGIHTLSFCPWIVTTLCRWNSIVVTVLLTTPTTSPQDSFKDFPPFSSYHSICCINCIDAR